MFFTTKRHFATFMTSFVLTVNHLQLLYQDKSTGFGDKLVENNDTEIISIFWTNLLYTDPRQRCIKISMFRSDWQWSSKFSGRGISLHLPSNIFKWRYQDWTRVLLYMRTLFCHWAVDLPPCTHTCWDLKSSRNIRSVLEKPPLPNTYTINIWQTTLENEKFQKQIVLFC